VALVYAVKEADFLYLPAAQERLTMGNLPSRLAKLEESGYARMEKTYKGKLPLTVDPDGSGRQAFERYRETLRRALTSGSR